MVRTQARILVALFLPLLVPQFVFFQLVNAHSLLAPPSQVTSFPVICASLQARLIRQIFLLASSLDSLPEKFLKEERIFDNVES